MYDQSILERFWSKVKKTDGCWEWMASLNNKGYGRFGVTHENVMLAHRVSWTIHKGPIPEGMCILHHCDNPLCVRLDHLFIGTKMDNTQDAIRKGRLDNRGSKHGFSRFSEQTIILVRYLHDRGLTQKKLAEIIGTGSGHICRIVNRKVWRHI